MGSELGIRQIDRVGVVIAVFPILHVVRPGLPLFQGFRDPVVIYQPLGIIFGIQRPGQMKLLLVVAASHRLGFGF